jgi:hypothetical protein
MKQIDDLRIKKIKVDLLKIGALKARRSTAQGGRAREAGSGTLG